MPLSLLTYQIRAHRHLRVLHLDRYSALLKLHAVHVSVSLDCKVRCALRTSHSDTDSVSVKENDAETSIAVHKAKAAAISSAEEKHGGTGSEYIKSVVFGGLDGIITTFSIVAAVAGASLSPE